MNSKLKGRSIELYFVDGHPQGMKTATIPFQWTGHVLVINRTQLPKAMQRSEVERPGVYLLVGENEGRPLLYIGETDDIKTRLRNHASKKDWWSEAICITSNGEPLNKAHARYLESKLISDALRLRKIALENEQSPPERTLSEAARAHMDDFLENTYLVLPALRYDFFTENRKVLFPKGSETTASDAVRFITRVPGLGVEASAVLIDEQFVVQMGSGARLSWVGAQKGHPGYQTLFNELIDQGILVENGDHRIFSDNYGFSSTSAAGAIIKGRATAGPTTWTVEGTNQKYSDWEADQLDVVSKEG
ncbi:GIY-YIG nuclease family protein [Parasphingorhabdus sp. JC815]|uniref:GIY-YIG nuclease family protein n=1 Tax=Parasphingorhabdus sp. JC815 TaxID=3232140 RepID=UPI0034581EEC